MSRLLVFGDLHCDRRHLRGLVERAVEERCDALVSLGDLCRASRKGDASSVPPCSAARASSFCSWTETTTTRKRSPAPPPASAHPAVRLGFCLHHLPAGTRFRLGRLRCLAYGGSPTGQAGRGWYRATALERAAFERLAGSGEIDVLFCHDPRTLEQGRQARGPFAALATKLRPALVIYAHQHRPHASASGQPALLGLGCFRDGQSSAVVLDSDETSRLVQALRRRAAAEPEAGWPPSSAGVLLASQRR